jgi:hypothetical protein
MALVSGSAMAGEATLPAAKPLYQFTETEVGAYLDPLQTQVPDLRQRILHLARKNIGQPYELYLLGEMPFETHDPQPLYCLSKSDCLVFTEHVYAMALSRDWSSFMRMLQRIRYSDGHIGVATRNHYTEADWNLSNRWLVREITGELAAGTAVKFSQRIDRSKFLLGRYKLKTSFPIQERGDAYLPYAEIARAAPHLRDGDFINVVRGVVKPGTSLSTTPSAAARGWGMSASWPTGPTARCTSSTPPSPPCARRPWRSSSPGRPPTTRSGIGPARRASSASSFSASRTIR